MEYLIGQLMIDSPVSSNWIIAGLLAVALFMIKKAIDKGDAREKKIDDMLEAQQKQINDHSNVLVLHEERLDRLSEDVGKDTHKLAEEIMAKIKLLKQL